MGGGGGKEEFLICRIQLTDTCQTLAYHLNIYILERERNLHGTQK